MKEKQARASPDEGPQETMCVSLQPFLPESQLTASETQKQCMKPLMSSMYEIICVISAGTIPGSETRRVCVWLWGRRDAIKLLSTIARSAVARRPSIPTCRRLRSDLKDFSDNLPPFTLARVKLGRLRVHGVLAGPIAIHPFHLSIPSLSCSKIQLHCHQSQLLPTTDRTQSQMARMRPNGSFANDSWKT
jgi:hypothetical protein